MSSHCIGSILVANRSEIAIRVMRAAAEMNIRTVGVYSQEDRSALHRFKADESYLVGVGKKPLAAYLDIESILRVAHDASVDAIHPGYGFLSENPEFAQAVLDAGIEWIGPPPAVMRTLGNKVAARNAAVAVGVPVMPATEPLPDDPAACQRLAEDIGYPLMLKASWGGGGRGMRVIESADELETKLPRRGAKRWRRSATTRSISRSWCNVRGTSRCRCWPIATAASCICTNATAACSGATRRWSSARRRRISTLPRATRCAAKR